MLPESTEKRTNATGVTLMQNSSKLFDNRSHIRSMTGVLKLEGNPHRVNLCVKDQRWRKNTYGGGHFTSYM